MLNNQVNCSIFLTPLNRLNYSLPKRPPVRGIPKLMFICMSAMRVSSFESQGYDWSLSNSEQSDQRFQWKSLRIKKNFLFIRSIKTRDEINGQLKKRCRRWVYWPTNWGQLLKCYIDLKNKKFLFWIRNPCIRRKAYTQKNISNIASNQFSADEKCCAF